MSEAVAVVAHTPGPWSIHRLSHDGVVPCVPEDGSQPFEFRNVFVGAGEKVVAEVVMWTAGANGGYPRVDNTPEQDANARLITSAPDLLSALKDVLSDIDSGVLIRNIARDGEPNWSMEMLAFVRRLQAAQMALARAEGR